MIIKATIFTLALIVVSANDQNRKEARRHRFKDPFAALDHHLSHSLAYHYMWPWSDLIKAAAAFDAERNIEEPKILTDSNNFVIHLNAKKFKPEELKVKVKNRYVTVEGKHSVSNDDNKQFVANHFVQQFVLPPGSKAEEVTAVFNEKGILVITAPKHDLPPPIPEREVPIEVKIPEPTAEPTNKPTEVEVELTTKTIEVKTELTKATETPNITETKLNPVTKEEATRTTEKPTEKITELQSESTTHVNKVKKKELKITNHHTHENEVTKLDNNGLDYALIETEE